MYLAGDIGGTKTHLALYQDVGGSVECLANEKFPSQKYENLIDICREFLKDKERVPTKACFGIAGPVKGRVSHATNLPWIVDADNLEKELGVGRVALINDLEANAYGIKTLSENDFMVLNKGESHAVGNQALISAGTGLGEAGIFWDGNDHIPFACEGGHSDFAPRNDLEIELLKYLKHKFGHVSYERILSGPGIFNLYRFLVETKRESDPSTITEEVYGKDAPKIITKRALSGDSQACMKTLELFLTLYGSEAGNAALKFMAYGGIFIGGGIAPKIFQHLDPKLFVDAFIAKGRFSSLLSAIPIKVVLNENTALLGAMYYARNII